MYLIRIYGRGFAEQYIGSEKKKTIQNVQQFLREEAGFILDKQSNEEKSVAVPVDTISKEIEKLTKTVEEHKKMQERFEADLNQLMNNQDLLNQKEKQKDDSEKADKKSEEEMKRVQKLEVDNEVLKYEIAHKDEVANLQLQLQMSMKDAEIKQANIPYNETEGKMQLFGKDGECMKTLDQFKAKQMENSEFAKEYEAVRPEMDVIRAIVEARTSQNLTQKELAKRSGINQADISKLENGSRNPSINLLKRLADGMGMTLKIEFVPKNVAK